MRRYVLAVVVVLVLAAGTARAAEPLKMGILPVLDTLPLQVAVQEGYFSDAGLDVELVPFSSALERDTAMQSGQIHGYFGDILNTLMLIQSGVSMRIVTVSYETTPGQRMFGLLLEPGKSLDSLQKGARVGISKGSIIEYLLERMERESSAVAQAGLERLEVKQIPIRMQMLLAGQLEAALLPEPLARLAETKGATAVASDEKLDMPLTVLCLEQDMAEATGPFLEAYTRAVKKLNKKPEAFRELMARTCRIPGPLAADYPMVRYPAPRVPTEAELFDVQQWMLSRGLLRGMLSYDAVVAD